jgi:TorA specific chaperone
MNPGEELGDEACADLAFMAEWLAQQFLGAPDAQRLVDMRSASGQVAVQWIGECLEVPAVAASICREVADSPPEALALTLQRRHTALFEGIFRHRSVPPYASVWDGTGHLFGPAVEHTRALLRELEVHLAADCCEPPDHIAIQLAALAAALRQAREDLLGELLEAMRGWTGRFGEALIAADGHGFHANLARLLAALLDTIALNCPRAAATQDIVATTAARI